MIPPKTVPILLSLVAAFCLPQLATAGTPKAKATPVHHHTVIETVSADSITIKAADGTHTYKITRNTEISFKGQTTTASQLQAGMRVQVTPDAADDGVAGEIAADDPPKDPSPKPKK